MTTVGQFSLQWALILGVLGLVAGFLGLRRRDRRLQDVLRRTAIVLVALLTLAEWILLRAILQNDFSLTYVASYSSQTLPTIYKYTVLWAGQSGSLLFWAWLLAVGTLLYVMLHWRRREDLRHSVTVVMVLQAVLLGFLAILLFMTSPFEMLPHPPVDGNSLNPLLQNPWMAVHPPILFLGFVGMTFPFAIAIASLVWEPASNRYLRRARGWTLVGWCFLTIGIVIGGFWAYLELGWGGYWAWDPVENASLIPWLTGTALLHTLIVQQHRGMFKAGNALLAGITFALIVFGTYLTRSGVLSSLHAFAPNYKLGAMFLVIIGLVLAVTIGLVIKRWGALKPQHEMASMSGRDLAFMVTALLFLLLAFAVFMGTTLPIWTRLLPMSEVTVGIEFYNKVSGPLFLLILLMMGIAPLLGWRHTSAAQLRRVFTLPAILAVVTVIGLAVWGIRQPAALVGYGLCVFAAVTLIGRLAIDSRATAGVLKVSLWRAILPTIWRRRRRYGGLLSHLAIICIYTGVIASSFHKSETTATLAPSETLRIGQYELRYDDLRFYRQGNANVMEAQMAIFRNGEQIGNLSPQKRLYDRSENVMAEASRRTTPIEDLYVILAGVTDTNMVTLQAHVNPLVGWIWWSCFLLVIGVLMSLFPNRRDPEPELATT